MIPNLLYYTLQRYYSTALYNSTALLLSTAPLLYYSTALYCSLLLYYYSTALLLYYPTTRLRYCSLLLYCPLLLDDRAFLAKREAAQSPAALTAIDAFLLEELRRLAALPPMPAGQTSPAAQFVTEWQAFARGAEWRAFARRAKDSDVRRAWAQWRAFGAERDRAAPLVATASDEDVASVVSNVGVARIEHALSHATAAELRAHVLAARDSGQKAQAQQVSPEVLSAMDADSDAVSRLK